MAKRQKHHNHTRVKYKNLALVGVGLIMAVILSQVEAFHLLLLNFGSLGWLGVLIAGSLFVSTFTVATGALMLSIFAEEFPLPMVAVLAGIGGVIGDLTIFHLVRDNLLVELKDVYRRFGGKHATMLLHTRYFRWTLPVLGAVIIASPLPDELGVSFLGLSKMGTTRFILLSFLLNAAGIFLLLSAVRLVID